MQINNWILSLAIYFIYLIVLFVRSYLRGDTFKFTHFKFSVRNYYILMLPLAAPSLFAAISKTSAYPLLEFVFLAIAGVVGEVVFSIWWDAMFEKRFWVYRVQTMFKSYTSWLNFIPWAVGANLYLLIWRVFAQFVVDPLNARTPHTSLPAWQFAAITFGATLVAEALLLWLWRSARGQRFEAKNVSFANYALFCTPILVMLTGLGFIYSTNYFALFAVMAIVAWIAEYMFGKMCHLFLSKRLWSYTYAASDHGHITPLSIIPFGLAGFYFLFIYSLFSSWL